MGQTHTRTPFKTSMAWEAGRTRHTLHAISRVGSPGEASTHAAPSSLLSPWRARGHSCAPLATTLGREGTPWQGAFVPELPLGHARTVNDSNTFKARESVCVWERGGGEGGCKQKERGEKLPVQTGRKKKCRSHGILGWKNRWKGKGRDKQRELHPRARLGGEAGW